MTYKLTLLILCLPWLAGAQISRISHQAPQAGDSVDIYYQPQENSKFKLGDPLYVRLTLYYNDYKDETILLPMERQSQEFKYKLGIRKGVAVYEINFQVGSQMDRQAAQSIQPRDEKGNYLRNAFWLKARQSEEGYQQELEHYPQNYRVYKMKWQILSYGNKEKAKKNIREDLALLKQKAKKNESYYYALTCGYAQLGNFEKSRATWQELMNQFPQSPLISQAYSDINYQLYTYKKQDKKIQELAQSFTQKHPESILARDNIGLHFKNDVPQDTASIRAICQHWLVQRPDLGQLSYHRAQIEKDQAQQLYYLNQAAQKYLNPKNALRNFYYWDNYTLIYYLKQVIEAFAQNGAEATALAYIYLYEKYSPKKDGSFYHLKAQVLQSLGRDSEALESYIYAREKGLQEAWEKAQQLYQSLPRDETKEFEEYYNQVAKKLFYAEETSPAPAFKAKDLNGKEWSLSALKGKVVVLNFWFIGCLPCREEIPGLNEMVAKYDPKKVIFLAFALDDTPHLQDFLAKESFDYQVFPESDKVGQAYAVRSYPTHVIIDKEGKIRSTLIGGSAQRHLQIQPLIDRLLKF
ncbi:MAG: TlpA disulfide reductase family protein [Bacteroidota bacterium]